MLEWEAKIANICCVGWEKGHSNKTPTLLLVYASIYISKPKC